MAPETPVQPKILQFRLRRLLASMALFSVAFAGFRGLLFQGSGSPSEYGVYGLFFCAGLFGAGAGALFRGGLLWGFLVGMLAPIGAAVLSSLFNYSTWPDFWSDFYHLIVNSTVVSVLGVAATLLGIRWLRRPGEHWRERRRPYLLWALVLSPLALPAFVVSGVVLSHFDPNGPQMRRRLDIASNQNIKELCLAISAYRHDHGEWPEQLADVQSYVGKPAVDPRMGIIGKGNDFAALLKNPFTGDDPGYEYVKPPEEPDDGTIPAILYSLRGGRRGHLSGEVFANGHIYSGGSEISGR